MERQEPSVGRIVHYVSHGTPVLEDGTQAFPKACRAAVITQLTGIVHVVGLAVLNPTGMFFHPEVACDHSEDQEPGSWHWPEIVKV